MERFAIKIDKAVKSKLKNLCRLCGIDNPDQVEILGEEEFILVDDDDEVPLSRKIFECVGIQVNSFDVIFLAKSNYKFIAILLIFLFFACVCFCFVFVAFVL